MAQKARLYIAEALLILMEDQKFEDIRIQDLTKKAGVSRMTYYRYFADKSEVLDYYMNYIFDLFMEDDDKNGAPFNSIEHIIQCLEFFREYGHFALCLYNAGMEGIMLKAINKYMYNRLDGDERQSLKAYRYYSYAGTIYNCYMQWVVENFRTDVKSIAKIIQHA